MVRDDLAKYISSTLPSNKKHLADGIIKYIDKNSNVLYSSDLSNRISFDDSDRLLVFDSCGLNEALIDQAMDKSKVFYKDNKILRNPFYTASLLSMSYCLNNKDRDTAMLLMVYMSLMMYTSIHYGFVKYGANKAAMDFTINNLDNNFKIKKLGTLFSMLEDNSRTCFETYEKMIKNCDDSDIVYVVFALHTRIKGKMRKIFNKYYENKQSGRYLNLDTESNAEDNFRQIDNDSYAINKLASKVYLNILHGKIDERFIKYSITRSDTSFGKLKSLIEDVIDSDDDQVVLKMITSMIEYYSLYSQNRIDTIYKGEYITFMLSAYASNTDAEQMVYIKTSIDRWLKENMYKYGKSSYGKTAMSSYKKAFYSFFIYTINYEAKS